MRRLITLILTGIISAFLACGVFAQVNITVGANILVSSAQPGWEHSEYVADGDPSDPNRIMVCSMRFSQARNQLVSSLYTTFDGGKSWEIGNTDDSSRFGGGVG